MRRTPDCSQCHGGNVKIVGVTGRIGSGKTTLCRILAAHHGVPVIDADSLGHEALRDPGNRGRIAARFGAGVLDPRGDVDRSALAQVVFSDREALRDLEDFVHPWIVGRIAAEVARLQARGGADIVLIDAALLLSWKDRMPIDRIVWVRSPAAAAIARLRLRGVSEDEAVSRLASQVSEEELQEAADLIASNGGTMEDLGLEAERIWNAIRRPA
jgi:dephospho-CoA kinase